MIPQISEINFPSYATLDQATVSLADMGDRTITTQVKIDGAIVPDFTGWELEFRGERFILPTRVPQAAKGNESINSIIDLTFESWAVHELKRYFFVQTATITAGTGIAGTVIADQYEASVNLSLVSFVELFNSVLQYYFGDKMAMILAPPPQGGYSTEPVLVEINKTYVWDVLTKFYELYGLRWRMTYNNTLNQYQILVGYEDISIDDHDFQYGYQGGLLKFERQVQDYNITNVLLGRGGEKNLPYRYFKRVDEQNPNWAADPDAIPELANIYFDRLRDANFRSYVQGWRTNPRRDTSWEVVQAYDAARGATDWAYKKGHTDEKFNPVEYVKDDESIAKYGEHWGARDDDDDIFPTIQGITREPIGAVDEVVDVSEIISDDIDAAAEYEETVIDITGTRTVTHNFGSEYTDTFYLGPFSVPAGQTGTVSWTLMAPWSSRGEAVPEIIFTSEDVDVKAVNVDTGTELGPAGLPAGTYKIKLTLHARNAGGGHNYITYGLNTLKLTLSAADDNAWKPTFDIWVKNIWNTTKGANESAEAYADRVWADILGDRTGKEAKIVFSTGLMSVSEDYEFTIASYPVFDQSKDINGVPSEWRITLYKSDADLEATGLYIPSASGGKPAAGDHFFFIGIDMPHLYVTEAEKRLRAAKEADLEDLADISPTWVITMDKVRVHTEEDADEYGLLADRLDAGVKLRITDPRFTGGDILSLYAQSITYTWDGSSIVPDIEVVLSDDVVAVEGAVQQIRNDVNVIKTRYVQAYQVDEVVRRVGRSLFLSKTGEPDTSYSPSTFKSRIGSDDFREGGIGGSGWGFYKDGQGRAILEADKIIVRQDMEVNSLVANQIAYVGGKQIISAASIECTQVVDSSDLYICYFDQKKGSVANLFKEGDIAMGQTFSPENKETRYYRYYVDSAGDNYIALEKADGVGGAPSAGDTIVQFGNASDTDRQYVIIRDVIGGGYERMLSGLNSVTAEGKEYYFAGMTKEGSEEFVALQDKDDKFLYDKNDALLGYAKYTAKNRWFVGDKDAEYAEWIDGALTVKGRIIVRNSAGQYKQMENYLATIDYLQAAMPEDEQAAVTTIAGGIVLSKIIGVESSGNLVAGLNASSLGSDNTHGTLMIFAGADDAASVSSAKFRVYADGHVVANDLYATGANIAGKITASSGSIGVFTITSGDGKLVSSGGDRSIELTRNGVSVVDGYYGLDSFFGGEILPDPDLNGFACVRLTTTGTARAHAGIIIDTSDSSDTIEQYSIYAKNGMFGGLRPRTRFYSAGTINLNEYDFHVVINNSAMCTVKLPDNPKIGQTYFIWHVSTSGLRIEPQGSNIGMYNVGTSQYETYSVSTSTGLTVLVFQPSDFSSQYTDGVWVKK